jgi:hypothetical protein
MAKQAQQPKEHRGRIQAQGPDTEESESWGQDTPPTKTEILGLLDKLWAKLTEKEQKDRETCLTKAKRCISTAPAEGYEAVYSPSFRNKKRRGGVRIDIEIKAGRACVDDPV